MKFLLPIIILFQALSLQGQTTAQPDSLNEKALRKLVLVSTAGYAVGMTTLYQLWYKQEARSSFRWFNDNREWLQLDKAGHALTAFHLARASADGLTATGLTRKKARLYGAAGSWLMMSTIEVFDGYSPDYGASWGDLLANGLGSSLFMLQDVPQFPLHITPKFSFQTTTLASLRPATLGENYPEQFLKDYNGQTYWLCLGVKDSKNSWLRWLNLAIGYGGSNMLYASPEENRQAGYQARRQWYLAPDINLRHIPTKKGWLRFTLRLIDMIHLPAPTLSFSEGQWKFHPLYF